MEPTDNKFYQTTEFDLGPGGVAYSYEEMIYNILANGNIENTRLGLARAMYGTRFVWPAGLIFSRSKYSPALAWVEACSILSGHPLTESMLKIAAPKLQWEYTPSAQYGVLLGDQLIQTVKHLRDRPQSRRAICHIGQPKDIGDQEKPCVDSYAFSVIGNCLEMFTFVRSWDLTSGFIYDSAAMSFVALAMAEALHLQPGFITAFAMNAHVYQKDYDEGRLDNMRQTKAIAFSSLTEEQDPLVIFELRQAWAATVLYTIPHWHSARIPPGLISYSAKEVQ